MNSRTTSAFHIRPARHDEVAKAATIIADSFGPVEPYLVWLFPHSQDRAKSALPLVQYWAEHAYTAGTLMVAVTTSENGATGFASNSVEHVAGAAIWTVEDGLPESHKSSSTAVLSLQRRYGIMLRDFLSDFPTVVRLLGCRFWRYYYEAFLSKKARGYDPQCYLSSLAVAAEYRGYGIAAQLLNHPPREGLLETLECREELVGFYSRRGFTPGRSYRLPCTCTMVSFKRYS